VNLLELIRQLAAAESDRERTALRAAIAANLRAASVDDLNATLTALHDAATELATQAESEDNVTLLEAYAEQHQAVTAELTNRSTQSTLSDRQRAALATFDNGGSDEGAGTGSDAARHDPADDAAGQGGTADGTAPVPNPTDQAGDSTTGSEGTDGGEGGEHERPEGQQAAARNLGALSNRRRGNDNTGDPNTTITMRTVVDGDVPGFTAGTALDRDSMARAFAAKARALNSAGAAGRHTVVHVEFDYPQTHTLGTDYSANMERMNAARRPESLTAAAQSGGLCLPLQVLYDIATVGVTNRPVRDSLTPFRVERGALQYRLPFDALSMTEGLGIWGQDNDQSVTVDGSGDVTYANGDDSQGNPFGPKSCFIADCPGVVEASIYSTYMCLEFPNMTSRFDPEWVQATNDSAQVAHARFSENQLLSRIMAASKIVYGAPSISGTSFSAVREMLANYDKVISYYRNRHRLDTTVQLSTILPQWLVGLLATDVARMMNTSGDISTLFSVAATQIETWFRTRNVDVTWHLDGLAATDSAIDGIMIPQQFYNTLAAGATVPGWPNAVDSVLYVTGDWLLLDGGTLDLGLVRDSTLNMRNRYQTFSETFEGVAFRGLESLRVVMPLVPNGASSGTIAPPATTDGMSAYTLTGG
jgi:hypothetical protein